MTPWTKSERAVWGAGRAPEPAQARGSAGRQGPHHEAGDGAAGGCRRARGGEDGQTLDEGTDEMKDTATQWNRYADEKENEQ